MACFGQFPVGPYTATWDGAALGLQEGPIRLQMTPSAEDVRCSLHGDSVVSSIYRGSNDFLILILKEWTAAVINAMWPFDTAGVTLATWPDHGLIGQCMDDTDVNYGPARQLVCTAKANTPAARIGPVTVTAPKACLAPQHTVEISLGLDQRLLALVFRLYPTDDGNTLSTFSITDP